MVTPAPTGTPAPTSTQSPSETKAPTNTSTPIPATAGEIAKNYIAKLESGGVVVEVARICIGAKEKIPLDFSGSAFNGKPVVVEFIFRISNPTEKSISVYVDQASIAVNDEQIDPMDYIITGNRFGDDLGGEMLPGVTKIGGFWTGLRRTPLDKVSKIQIKIRAPHDSSSYSSLGPDFSFTIDVKDWTFEQIPDELKTP